MPRLPASRRWSGGGRAADGTEPCRPAAAAALVAATDASANAAAIECAADATIEAAGAVADPAVAARHGSGLHTSV
jgi:hypothetical protein